MFRGRRLKKRAVICHDSAKCIGYVWDMEFDEASGNITAIIAIKCGFFRRFFGVGEMIIPWTSVTAISDEFVLVDMYYEYKK